MLGTLLLGAAVAGLATAVIAVFWKEIIQWLSKVVNVIKERFHRIIEGSELFLQKIGGRYKQISHNYSKIDNGQWMKDTVINKKEVDESEIPKDILEKAKEIEEGQKMDITENAEEQVLTLQNK